MLNQNRKFNSQWHILLKYYAWGAWNFIGLEIPIFYIVFDVLGIFFLLWWLLEASAHVSKFLSR